MATDPGIFDYTQRDYDALLVSLLDTAALKLPEWTDRSENDLGRLLLELFAQVGDVLLYYQDRIANEAFLATAVERRSVIDLLGLIGYALSTPAPAAVELTVTARNDTVAPLVVRPAARFATEAAPGRPPTEFSYLPVPPVPLSVPRDGSGGTVTATLTCVNAQQIADETLGTATGDAGQGFRLAQHPVLLPRDPDSQEYLAVEVDAGGGFERWQRRGTLLRSRSADPHYVVRIDAEDNAELVFGDATYGRVPPAGATVRATYLIGGGQRGNVGAGTVTVAKSGVNSPVTVVNRLAASGGAERESIEHARALAPYVFRSGQRAVTATDYAALTENVPGVTRAIAVSPSWNHVDVYVVDSAGAAPTDRLRAQVLTQLAERAMVTTLVSVRQPVFVRIDLAVTVGVEPTYYRDDVRSRVRDALGALFDVERIEFGQSFYLSKIYEAVESRAGVAYAQVTTFAGVRSDPPGEQVDPAAAAAGLIQLQPREFPTAGLLQVKAEGGLA
ncbi:putative baseplate assembly protein [Streptomyces fulvoviolaceus]|uniref:putative baseplate assembly protein n=1 Tax=Streptomyces fulvoviolaceus TaxID=285535 RepID=UPI0021BE51E7|nr:putative baseplate assembly protein [Streptomyces fulvoviolaceus]MCT9078064.1 putative baseplate assembly protein [Streptomyces fulvoviolaceus]